MATTELKYHEITGQVIGCAEIVYQRALMIELKIIPLICDSEIEKEIFYEGHLITKKRLDLIVENNILVELKAVVEIDNSCYAQIINYLRVFNIEVGLLLNFGTSSLQFKRFINTKQSVQSF